MWFKRPFSKFQPSISASVPPLCPWGDASSLSPEHLPFCISGDAHVLEVAATRLLAEIQWRGLPMFLQEGERPLVSDWERAPVPPHRVLPPVHAGTTRETIHQTLLEIKDWLSLQGPAKPGTWPALLVCSHLGQQRHTVMDLVTTVNRSGGHQLGVIYLQETRQPPLDNPAFAAQLYCHANGKAGLRRHRNHQSFQLDGTVPEISARPSYRYPAPKALA